MPCASCEQFTTVGIITNNEAWHATVTQVTGIWITIEAPLGWPAVFLREGACREANDAVRALKELADKWPQSARGGRKVELMDATYKLILGYFDKQ